MLSDEELDAMELDILAGRDSTHHAARLLADVRELHDLLDAAGVENAQLRDQLGEADARIAGLAVLLREAADALATYGYRWQELLARIRAALPDNTEGR